MAQKVSFFVLVNHLFQFSVFWKSNYKNSVNFMFHFERSFEAFLLFRLTDYGFVWILCCASFVQIMTVMYCIQSAAHPGMMYINEWISKRGFLCPNDFYFPFVFCNTSHVIWIIHIEMWDFKAFCFFHLPLEPYVGMSNDAILLSNLYDA